MKLARASREIINYSLEGADTPSQLEKCWLMNFVGKAAPWHMGKRCSGGVEVPRVAGTPLSSPAPPSTE